MNRTLINYTPETEMFAAEAVGDDRALKSESVGSLFSDSEELELAIGFLDVQSERHLDRFLRDLMMRTGQAIGRSVPSPTAQALEWILKRAASQALPIAVRAIGDHPDAQLGAHAAAAARIFGLELEGLSPEDKEFEIARSFVRFAGETVANAVAALEHAPSHVVARCSAAQAATRYAPGLLRHAPPPLAGRWVRRGRHIVVVNR
jgi:hypothetical protein